MKISVRVLPKDSVHYTGATLNVPESMKQDEIEQFAKKWVKENVPNHVRWFWKVYGR